MLVLCCFSWPNATALNYLYQQACILMHTVLGVRWVMQLIFVIGLCIPPGVGFMLGLYNKYKPNVHNSCFSNIFPLSACEKLITFRRPTMEKYRKSITYQGPKLWNNLPAQVQKLDTYHEFKSNVKKMFQPSKKPNPPKAILQSAKNKNGTQKIP